MKLSEEECLSIGGHCYKRENIVLTSDPPQYPETCRHCGKRRVAIPREPWEYRDR